MSVHKSAIISLQLMTTTVDHMFKSVFTDYEIVWTISFAMLQMFVYQVEINAYIISGHSFNP